MAKILRVEGNEMNRILTKRDRVVSVAWDWFVRAAHQRPETL